MSNALHNETIIVQLPTIDICFWDFQTHAKNGDSVPLNDQTFINISRVRRNSQVYIPGERSSYLYSKRRKIGNNGG